MDITLKGNNGEKVVIPIEDLIQKYWSDENSKPNRIEMSAKVKDETILAAMTICDEKEENYLSVDLESRNEKVEEKYGWLDVYVPEIDAAHRIFVPCGNSKAAAAANRLKMPCIDKSFVLLDDYSVNLHDWKEKGGSGIKLRNGINGSIGTWKGPSVSRFNTPETLATLICQAAKIRANATKEIIEMLRAKYPNGTRVRLVKMDDVQAPPIGTEGTVVGVDSIGNLLMHWDNGSGLNVVYGADEVEKI